MKLNGPGKRSEPDRMVLLLRGQVCFIEFKRPGQQATLKQAARLNQLRALGYVAGVAHDWDECLALVQESRGMQLIRPALAFQPRLNDHVGD
jgi:hypothetical protein